MWAVQASAARQHVEPPTVGSLHLPEPAVKGKEGVARACSSSSSGSCASVSTAVATADPPALESSESELEDLTQRLGEIDPRRRTVPDIKGSVWRLAASPTGSRLLQEILEVGDAQVKAQVVKELEGHVQEAWDNTEAAPHANYVLQKCVEVMPPPLCLFIRDEMVQSAKDAACSKYGCRILQRLIEHFDNSKMEPLLAQILAEETLPSLMVSKYGNFVVQCVLEHGSQQQRSLVASVLGTDAQLRALAENSYASHVVQRAMMHCSEQEQRLIVQKVLGMEGNSRLKHSVYGSFVAREAKKWRRLRQQVEAVTAPAPAPAANRHLPRRRGRAGARQAARPAAGAE